MEKDGSQITFRMLVSGSQTGSLIGKRGAKINQIREKTKASIRVIEDAPSGSYPGDRIIVVSLCSLSQLDSFSLPPLTNENNAGWWNFF